MLTFVVVVTMTAPDLDAVQAAYGRYLDYTVVDRGTVSSDLAAVWDAPRMEGRDYLLMQPASGEEVFLRVVQSPPVEGYAALRTFGWNANEILVEDPDALAEQLADSPFEIIGPPANLSSNEWVRAMQVIGPAGELNYLTRITPGKSAFDLGSAKSFVDRTFIVVVGGPEIEAMRSFYADVLGMPVTEPYETRVTVLSRAHGLPMDTQYPLAIARFPSSFLIEIDEYPPSSTTRPRRHGELPPGMATVGFATPSLDRVHRHWIAPARELAEKPYDGRRVAVVRGAAGELIELIETPSDGGE